MMPEKKNREYFNLFPVPIQITRLELNIDSLIEFCYEIKCKDAEGVKLTNVGGWHSDNVFDETHTEFIKLKNKIEEEANLYHHEIQLKKTHHQKLGKIWININQKGHLNDFHIHSYLQFHLHKLIFILVVFTFLQLLFY